MGKPKGKNAFWYFMIEKQNELKRNGQNYSINDSRLQSIAGDEWKTLTKEEREPFESKAKSEKDRLKNQPVFQVKPLTYEQRQQQLYQKQMSREADDLDDVEAREEYFNKLIECSVKACKSRDDLVNASFFVIGSNVMVRTDEKPQQWPPLELGICQYSIANGIQYTYHEFVDAGRVPMGYMHLSKEHADMTHRIPLDDFSLATNNYPKIVEDITAILDNSRFTNESDGKPTPMMVFCREDALEQNRGIFDWLAKRYAETYPGFKWDVEVLDLNTLVFCILNSIERLTTSAFDYSANTLCEYHEDLDNRYCARGLARALCYMMSQIFCPVFEISPTENHLPPKRDGVIADTYTGTLQEAKPFIQRYHLSHSDALEDWQPPENDKPPDEEIAQSKKTGIGRGRKGW